MLHFEGWASVFNVKDDAHDVIPYQDVGKDSARFVEVSDMSVTDLSSFTTVYKENKDGSFQSAS